MNATSRRTAIAVIAIATALPVSPIAQPARAEAAAVTASDLQAALTTIEQTVDKQRAAFRIPGAALVVVKDGRVLMAKGFGLRNVEKTLPVTPDTQFAIGSTTKAFTAMAAVMSAEKGKLSLEDTPKRFLPHFKLRDPEADAKVTLRDLLSHRTGVGRADLLVVLNKTLTVEDQIRILGEVKPQAPFRQKFLYQNTMVTAAGLAVGKAWGTTWERVVQDLIFRPLGMKRANTTVAAMQASGDYSQPYELDVATDRVRRVPQRDIPHSAPAGAINASVNDLARWLNFLLADGVHGGKRLVSAKGLRDIFTPQIHVAKDVSYGLGWGLASWRGHVYATHQGSIDGFNATAALMPDQKLGFFLLTNVTQSGIGQPVHEAVWSALVPRAVQTEEPLRPNAGEALAATDEAGKALFGEYRCLKPTFALTIGIADGRVCMMVAGQRPYGLVPKGPDRFRLATLPESFGLEVQRTPDGKLKGLRLLQPQGDFDLVPSTSFQAPMTGEALMSRVIMAAGGEANLNRHRTLFGKADVILEDQGLTGKMETWGEAPCSGASRLTLMGLGRELGRIDETFDGSRGGTSTSFSPPSTIGSDEVAESRVINDFYGPLHWRDHFTSVSITGSDVIAGEPVHVVTKIPRIGNPVTDYVSTTSFRVLAQERVPAGGRSGGVPVRYTFADFRTIDGVVMPFKTVQRPSGGGETIVQFTEMVFDRPVPANVFAVDAN